MDTMVRDQARTPLLIFYQGLQQQIDELGNRCQAERIDALSFILASISRLSDEVTEATAYLPSYDQKRCLESVKELKDLLDKAKETHSPRPEFKFSRQKNPSALSIKDASVLWRPPIDNWKDDAKEETVSMSPSSINLNSRSNERLDLSLVGSGYGKDITITNVKNCILDLQGQGREESIAALALKDVSDCILFCKNIAGPALLRLHDCHDLVVYLCCGTKPIIEGCAGIKFSIYPSIFLPKDSTNLWDQVEDFGWLKKQASPHWSILPEEERLSDDAWKVITEAKDVNVVASYLP
ncbi:Tubulin-specific chaperone C [Neolecta irregularis DAH-3]|uniref:Tubulin-specific chaperone C n=1 Tax=Neolecta irregularis (strain DAH-3) TaxID=1198029 RepID=A0A1U7LRV5_NEOID|nr:Tubulin-specific chaperone C [Neolecta irregularis DAH-3]|eukprot:OLL25359.1 Tubulin-specific chaperone C [Neolecta irregularis DAH-3]